MLDQIEKEKINEFIKLFDELLEKYKEAYWGYLGETTYGEKKSDKELAEDAANSFIERKKIILDCIVL